MKPERKSRRIDRIRSGKTRYNTHKKKLGKMRKKTDRVECARRRGVDNRLRRVKITSTSIGP